MADIGQCGECKTKPWVKGEFPPCDDSYCTFPYWVPDIETVEDTKMDKKDNIRDVLVSYIEYVCDLEGTDFLGFNGQDINPAHMGEEWTPEQIAILQECRDEARVRGGW